MKVHPMKVQKTNLSNVPVGSLFTMDGVRYIKLSDNGRRVQATTVDALCNCSSAYSRVKRKRLEERVFCLLTVFTEKEMHPNIITYSIFDADAYRAYCQIMHPHIKDCWYVDNGAKDWLSPGGYLYVDEFCNLREGNEYTEENDGVSRHLGIRAMYWIEADAIVTVNTPTDAQNEDV